MSCTGNSAIIEIWLAFPLMTEHWLISVVDFCVFCVFHCVFCVLHCIFCVFHCVLLVADVISTNWETVTLGDEGLAWPPVKNQIRLCNFWIAFWPNQLGKNAILLRLLISIYIYIWVQGNHVFLPNYMWSVNSNWIDRECLDCKHARIALSQPGDKRKCPERPPPSNIMDTVTIVSQAWRKSQLPSAPSHVHNV